MSSAVPRLRMFAGPNGSGKTTVKKSLSKPESWFGIYINPDEPEARVCLNSLGKQGVQEPAHVKASVWTQIGWIEEMLFWTPEWGAKQLAGG